MYSNRAVCKLKLVSIVKKLMNCYSGSSSLLHSWKIWCQTSRQDNVEICIKFVKLLDQNLGPVVNSYTMCKPTSKIYDNFTLQYKPEGEMGGNSEKK